MDKIPETGNIKAEPSRRSTLSERQPHGEPSATPPLDNEVRRLVGGAAGGPNGGATPPDSPSARHRALLTDPRWNTPGNRTIQRAIALQLQRQYGNAYVGRLLRPDEVSRTVSGDAVVQTARPATATVVARKPLAAPAPVPVPPAATAKTAPAAVPAAPTKAETESPVPSPPPAAAAAPAVPPERGAAAPKPVAEQPTKSPEPAMPAAATPGQQFLLNVLADSAREGREELSAAALESIDDIVDTANEQSQGITEAEEEQVTVVSAAAEQATADVDTSVAEQTDIIESTEASEQERIAAWESTATGLAQEEVQARATQVEEAGTEQQRRASEAGDAAAVQAQATLSGAATSARDQGSSGSGSGAAAEGHAEVADRVSSDAAEQMVAAAGEAGAQLQTHASEAVGELGSHVGKAAAAVAAEAGPLTDRLGETAAAAQDGVVATGRDTKQALRGQGRFASQEIAAAEAGATAELRTRAAGHRDQVAEASTAAIEALRERSEEAAEASRDMQSQAAEALARAQVDEETAADVGGEIRARMAKAHGEAATMARSAGSDVSKALSGVSAESAAAMSVGTDTVASRLGQATDTFATHAGSLVDVASEAMGTMREAAASAGDNAVTATVQTLDTAASTAATGFSEAVGTLEQRLNEGASEVDTRSSEALNDTRGRIAQGQRRVDEHLEEGERERGPTVQRSVLSDIGDWFAEQLADLWNMLKSPSFWVGLIVTLVLFPVMGPGALVIGGLAGGIVAGIEENVRSGRSWYDPHAIIRNAAIGVLAGAAMAFGVGVLIGLGLEGAAFIAAVMALSAGIGIAVNVATGQRWDRGLLANLFLAWLFARIFGPRPRTEAPPPETPPGRASTRVPGLAESIDPANPPPGGWRFSDTVTTSGGKTTVETVVTAPDGTTGSMGRSYNARTGEFSMDYAFLDKIPNRWVQTTPEMVSGRGTPLETYMTMRQMRILEQQAGATFSGPRVVHMSTIINKVTCLQLGAREAALGRPMTTAELNTAILETHSVQYARNSITQTGGRIASARVSNVSRMTAGDIATLEELSTYGVRPDQQIPYSFNIDLDVVPAGTLPAMPPPVGTVPVPLPPGHDAGND